MARITAAMRLRQALETLLEDRASFCVLLPESKEPSGPYRVRNGKIPRNRSKKIPMKGNYGVIPERDFIILDLDVHRSDLHAMILFFEALFDVKLKDTLCVRTPSGGIHYYLRLPEGSGQVFNGSLRGYVKILNDHNTEKLEFIDADIRSSDATGYVVGPMSYVTVGKNGSAYATPGEYKLLGKSKKILESGSFEDLAEISRSGVALLNYLREVQLSKKGPKDSPQKILNELDRTLNSKTPPPSVLHRISRKMDKSIEFHRQRYFVFRAIECCYSDMGIAAACEALNISRDTYSAEKLSFWEIVNDMRRLRTTVKMDHSAYCEAGFLERHPEVQVPADEKLSKIKHKIATRTLARAKHKKEPKVVNMERALKVLDSGTPKVPQRVRDAILLLDVLFQPMVNVGATRVVVAKGPVVKKLGLTDSRISDALRLLRQKGIIAVKDRQRPGLAATYRIEDNFIHKRLTGGLKHRWLMIREKRGESVPLIYDRWSNSFVEIHSSRAYKADVPRGHWRVEFNEKQFEDSAIFARAYVHDELAKLVVKPN